MQLVRFTTNDTAYLSFADAELLGKSTVRRVVRRRANLCYLFIRQLGIRRLFAYLVMVSTFCGAILSAFPVVVAACDNERLTATSAHYRFFATFPIRGMTISRPVAAFMDCRCEKNKVFNAVVGPIPIEMMHDFIWQKRATKMGGHHKPLFQNITCWPGVWMIGPQQKDISLFVCGSSTIPVDVPMPSDMMSRQISSVLATLEAKSCGSADRAKLFPASASAFHGHPPYCWPQHNHHSTIETFVQGGILCSS